MDYSLIFLGVPMFVHESSYLTKPLFSPTIYHTEQQLTAATMEIDHLKNDPTVKTAAAPSGKKFEPSSKHCHYIGTTNKQL